MRLIIGSIMHESNTFCQVKTDLSSFRKVQLLIGKQIVDYHMDKRTEIGGMLCALSRKDVEIVPTISANALPSGKVTSETFEFFKKELIKNIKKTKVDGILLVLHGAMVTEEIDDPEGNLLEEINNIIGKNTYIGVTLDMHANVSDLMVRNAHFLIGYRTHPHIDQWEIGRKAADIMVSLIKEQMQPTMVMKKLPMILPAETSLEPRSRLLKEIDMLKKNDEVTSISFFIGYPWADVNVIGSSVVVITKNNLQLAQKEADELANLFWRLREDFPLKIVSIDDAINDALNTDGGPIVFCDMGDSLFAGASGDVNTVLAALIKRRVDNVVLAAMIDPEAVQKAIELGKGKKATLEIGGKLDRLNSNPLRVSGNIKLIVEKSHFVEDSTLSGYEGDMGPLVIFETNGIGIVLAECRGKVYSPTFLRNLGIEPKKKKIVVVKDGIGPVVTYKSIAKKVIFVNTPGWSTQGFKSLEYNHIPRPIFPLDPVSI